MNNNRPKNNNVNGIIGNALGPSVYKFRTGNGGQYTFLNPQTLANLLGINVNKLNKTLKNKLNSNSFEKFNKTYGPRPVINPFNRKIITKSNIKKVAGPSKPVEVKYNINLSKARRNAIEMENALREQQRRAEEARGRVFPRARQVVVRRPRVPVVSNTISNTINRQSNLNELNRNKRFQENLERLVNSLPRNRNIFSPNYQNMRRWSQIAPVVNRLGNGYENYIKTSKELKRMPMYRVFDKRRMRGKLASLRRSMENNVKFLIGENANNISRLNNTKFKNKVYYTLKTNGARMKSHASSIRTERNATPTLG